MPNDAGLKQHNTRTGDETDAPEIDNADVLGSNIVMANPDSTNTREIGWKCLADVASLFSELFISAGDADPTDEDNGRDTVSGRTQLYFQTASDAIWLSVDGADWVEYLESGLTTIEFAETDSENDDDWHDERTSTDRWIRFEKADGEFESIPIASRIQAGNNITFTRGSDGIVTVASTSGGDDVVVQYAETNSETASDWHTTQADADDWIRIGVGDPVVYSDGIPLQQGDSVTFQYAVTDSDDDTDWHATQVTADDWIRVGTGDPVTYSTGIPLTGEATTVVGGDGIDVTTNTDDEEVVSVDDDYVNNLIDSSERFLEHFTLRHTNQFSSDTGNRWHSYSQIDGTGYTIEMEIADEHINILRAIVADSRIQIRNVNGSVVNIFTVESDIGDPDSDGVWSISGDYDNVRTFSHDTSYQFYFSHRREQSVTTDDESIEGSGLLADPIALKEVRDDHIADDFTTTEEDNFRAKIAASEEYHTIVSRLYEENVPRNQTGEVTLVLEEDEIYNLDIENGSPSNLEIEGTKNDDLVNHFFSTLAVGTKIEITNRDDVTWVGLMIGHESADTTDATLTINFEDGREGTFTDGEQIYISFGYAPTGTKPDDTTLEIQDDGQIGVKLASLDDTHIKSLSKGKKADFRAVIGANAFTVGDTVPTTNRKDGDWHIYRSSATSLSGHVDNDLTALTAVTAGDIFQYDIDNTRWIRRYEVTFDVPSDLTDAETRTIRDNIHVRTVSFVDSAPSSPLVDDVIIYKDSQTGLTGHRNKANTADITSIGQASAFQWNGTYWISIIEFDYITATQHIIDSLESVTNDNRLDSSAIKNLPTGIGQGAYYDSATRTIVVLDDRDSRSEIAINTYLSASNQYTLRISNNDDMPHLADLGVGSQVRISQGIVSWEGRVHEQEGSVTNPYRFIVEFHTRRGTFITETECKVEIGVLPVLQVTYIYGKNQNSTRYLNYGDTTQSLSSPNQITAQGLKRWDSTIHEAVNGGVDVTIEDVTDASDIDSNFTTNDEDTIIKVNETGLFKIAFSFYSASAERTSTFVYLKCVDSDGDDVEVITSAHVNLQQASSEVDADLQTLYQAEEEFISIESGDQFYVRGVGFQGTNNVIGYVSIRRQV